ncbi:Centrin-3 [Dimargaris cristalligena]|uniref:Centrosomal protein centrin 3 n=1 Tax=Dimargaris cristalligena TaxID=215637 RepID=A0A4Q0A3V6_9FUNG|nr:Centrin-3 [Dimargaris cristalligena]RKP40092.1 centrosomal protein centrin 3 [Dimargaris cristalligena]|eukprot:RKP40092.1 centrosomal protein centrin 3 [Dimargaris cristalligena]
MTSTSRSRQNTLRPEQLKEIEEAFNLFDTDGDLQLDYYEFKVAMKALGFEVPKSDVLKLLKRYDHPNGQKISQKDFQEIMIEKIQKRDPMEEIKRAFKLFDNGEKGKINSSDLRRVAEELGETIDEQELHAMIKEFDLDGDNAINFEEFAAIMREV